MLAHPRCSSRDAQANNHRRRASQHITNDLLDNFKANFPKNNPHAIGTAAAESDSLISDALDVSVNPR